jgi:hypothetical protein
MMLEIPALARTHQLWVLAHRAMFAMRNMAEDADRVVRFPVPELGGDRNS